MKDKIIQSWENTAHQSHPINTHKNNLFPTH
jgi:hypothetical protein